MFKFMGCAIQFLISSSFKEIVPNHEAGTHVPQPNFHLTAYPEESFSGLQLMCLMFAGFKRIAPDQDTGMDLNEPLITALGLF
jgi:hypothetical protein